MSRKRLIRRTTAIILIVVAIAIAAGYFIWGRSSNSTNQNVQSSATGSNQPAMSTTTFFAGSNALYYLENASLSANTPGSPTSSLTLTFQAYINNQTDPFGSTQGLNFSSSSINATISNDQGIQGCIVNILSSTQGQTTANTSSDLYELGNQTTEYTMQLQPACPLTDGYNTVELLAAANGDAHYGILGASIEGDESETESENGAVQNTPTRVVILNNPESDVVNVTRGGTINLAWYTTGGNASDTIEFSMLAGNGNPGEQQDVPANSDSYAFPVTVLPGTYTLSGTYPSYAQPYGTSTATDNMANFVSSWATISREVTVNVTGPAQTVSPASSSVQINNYNNLVPADGICQTEIMVTLEDQYGVGMSNQTATLTSNRSSDVITPEASTTDYNGDIDFTVQSSEIGTSTLTASADGVTVGQAVVYFANPLTTPCNAYAQ